MIFNSLRTDSSLFTCSSVCVAEKVTRNRALPSATVGGRIALINIFFSSNFSLKRNVCSLEPIIICCIAVIESIKFYPKSAAPCLNWLIKLCNFSLRQFSFSIKFKLVRVAAATAAGIAVVNI